MVLFKILVIKEYNYHGAVLKINRLRYWVFFYNDTAKLCDVKLNKDCPL